MNKFEEFRRRRSEINHQTNPNDLAKIRHLFQDAGLTMPNIPSELAVKLQERSNWCFSTQPITRSPYDFHSYSGLAPSDVNSTDQCMPKEDYAILAHSGYGSNSYAIQYYLVWRGLQLFLFLSWGGVYMEGDRKTVQIRDCFALADQIVAEIQRPGKLHPGESLKIFISDTTMSYWWIPGIILTTKERLETPTAFLSNMLQWLKNRGAEVSEGE